MRHAACPLLNVCVLPLLRVLTPHRSMLGGWLDRKQVGMAFVFTQQSLFKHLLTQGDKIVLTLASSLFDQGVYAVVTNYGTHTRHVGCSSGHARAETRFIATHVHVPVMCAQGRWWFDWFSSRWRR